METARAVKDRRDKLAASKPVAAGAAQHPDGAKPAERSVAAGPPVPAALAAVPVVIPVPVVAPCSGNDLAEMLSTRCLSTLSHLPVPVTRAVEVPRVQCAVAIFPSQGAAALPPPFTVSSIQQCVASGVGMAAGFPGLTNIVAADTSGGTFRVSCRRPGQDGRPVECEPQD